MWFTCLMTRLLVYHYVTSVFLKPFSQIPINILWHTQLSIIISKQKHLIFIASCVRNLLRRIFIPNIRYCIITVWIFRSIDNLSVFSLDMIILFSEMNAMFLATTDYMRVRNFLHLLTAYLYFRLSTISTFSSTFLSSSTKNSRYISFKFCFTSFNRYIESPFNFLIFLLFC